jgi:DNA-nicking Smr family endonuclease
MAQQEDKKGSATTSLGSLLQGTKLPKPAPSRAGPHAAAATVPSHEGGAAQSDRARSGKPSRGVQVQPGLPDARAVARAEETAARKRVAALVSGGLHFKVKCEGEHVQAARGSSQAKLFARLVSKTYAPELTLDLTAQPDADVADSIAGFLRLVHRRGVRQIVITLHDGTAPEQVREHRRQSVIAALTQGAASPLVRAFSSAHERLGGTGSLVVLLI